MNDRDIIKFTIYSKTMGLIIIITSRESAAEFRDEVITNQMPDIWHEIHGKLNHIDSNDTTITIAHDDIAGFDLVETNKF